MKKIALSSMLSAAFFAASCSASQAAEIEAFDMQRCVNMGNSFDAPRGEPWGKPINPDHFEMIRSKGFDTVRIPVRWSDYMGDGPDHKIESDFIAKVEAIIDEALAQNLNVILNVHHFEHIMEHPKDGTDALVAMWEQIAPKFSNKSDSLWFEVLNEPNNKLKGDDMRRAQALAIRAIRKSNPSRIIILGGEDWSGIRTLESNLVPPDENIVYTYHYYDPFDFTHQKAPWVGKDGPKKTKNWGNESDYDDLRQSIKIAEQFEKDVQRPVFVGEFGAYEVIDNAERVQYVRDTREAFESAQIPWCLWSFSNTFPLYDEDNGGWDEDMLAALITKRDVLKTQVVTRKDVTADVQDWGQFLPYYVGDTDFTSGALTGVAEIKPGQEIHPPHKHIEEEYLMILEGNGTWTIEDQDFPAKAGDILYAEPWVSHGIKNTGNTTLKFVVFKYNKP